MCKKFRSVVHHHGMFSVLTDPLYNIFSPRSSFPFSRAERRDGRPGGVGARPQLRTARWMRTRHTDTVVRTPARSHDVTETVHTYPSRRRTPLAAKSHLSCLSRRGSRPLTASPGPPPRNSPLYRRCYWLSCRHMTSAGRSLRPSSCRHRQELPAELQVAAGWSAAGPCAEAGSYAREAPMHCWPRHHHQ